MQRTCWCALGIQLILRLAPIWLLAHPATASQSVATACDRAAALASQETGVPVPVLRAIALTETGRKVDDSFLPWPWTVNLEGAGKWFTSPQEALDYVQGQISRGKSSFDVGCFQINYRWHGEAFASVDEMFDPMANAIYAARFLAMLHDELGGWSEAAGAYHSRTPELASKYRQRFDRIRAQVAGEPVPVPQPGVEPIIRQPRQNSFPLLIGGGGGQGGSLFSQTLPGAGPFIAAAAAPLLRN